MRRPSSRLWVSMTLAAVMAMGPTFASADSAVAAPPSGFTTVPVLSGVDAGHGGVPTSFAYAPDGRIFIGRKTGVVDVWDRGVKHTFIDMRDEVNSVQSRGLVGMALDPNFAVNGRLFILYTQELRPDDPDQGYPAGGQLISIKSKASDPDTADPASKIVLVTGFNSVSRLHAVAGLRFDNDGNILAGFADASDNGVNQGQALAAEDLDKLNGKLLRIDPTTGKGIPGNPYYNAANPSSVRSRIYARGLRNPWRFTVDPQNGNVYMGEVGWNTWEQLEVFTPTFTNADRDRNGGWPCYEGGNGVALVQPDYQSAPVSAATCRAIYKPSEGGTGVGALAPIYGYRHDDPGGDNGSAILAGPKYTGTSNYPAPLIGKVFIADFSRDRLQTVDPTTGAVSNFGTPGTWGLPVDMQIAPDGNVAWLGLGSGELREIVYTGGANRAPTASAAANVTVGQQAPFTVKFSAVGSSDPDGDALTYQWNFGDGTPLSTKIKPKHVFTRTGAFVVTLTVSDGHVGGTDTDQVVISVGDAAPTISFTAPPTTLRYAIGDTIHVTLVANDADDGPLTGESVQTDIIQHTGGHAFPGGQFSGLSGSFVTADLGFEDTYYELVATATDSSGQSTTVTRNVLPATAPVTVASAPSGVTVTVDGIAHTTPYTWSSIVGSVHEVVAPSTTSVGGVARIFDTWATPSGLVSDVFAAFTTPAVGTTSAARYNPVADGIAISDASVVEGASGLRPVALTISRSAPTAVGASVAWTAVNGSATAPADFKNASGTVTFAANETSRTITVKVKGDTAIEPAEQLSVQLSNATGGTIVQATGRVTILDDDPPVGGLRVDVGDVEVLEGGSGTRSAAFTVALSAPSPGAVTVQYKSVNGSAVAPTDYAAVTGTLTFAAGQIAKTVAVAVAGDRDSEPTEQFTLALSNPAGATIGRGTGTARIATDDAQARVSISSGIVSEGDAGQRVVPFTVSLAAPSASPVTADWTVSHVTTTGADVVAGSGTVTIPAGALGAAVNVTTIGDTVVEPNEAFVVTLSNAVGASIETGTGVEYIRDDDPGSAGRVAIGSAAIVEGQNGTRDAVFVVSLSEPHAATVTVNYATTPGSATAGTDYVSAAGTLTFAAGALTRLVTVPITGDSLDEAVETFTVTLSGASGATISLAVGTGSIVDDD